MNNYEDEEGILEDGETVRVSLMLSDNSILDKLITKENHMNTDKARMDDAYAKSIANVNAWRDGATLAPAHGSAVTVHDGNRHLFDSSHLADAKRRCDDAYAASVLALTGGR